MISNLLINHLKKEEFINLPNMPPLVKTDIDENISFIQFKVLDKIPTSTISPNDNLDSMSAINRSKKCCLVKNQYIEDKPKNIYNMYDGNFKYIYEIKNECNPLLYNLDNNTQLLVDGENGWDNNNCNNTVTDSKEKLIGSCRNANHECVDYMSKSECVKYKMIWSDLTCRDPLPYTWKEKIDTSDNIISKNKFSIINKLF